PQQMDANLATLERLHAQLRQNSDSQTRAAERRQTLSSQLAEAESFPIPSVPGGPAIYATPELREAARLAEKKEELAKLRSMYHDKYPDVIQAASEVERLEKELAAAKTRAPKEPTAAQQTPPPTPANLSPYALRLKEA